jgi:hypothetical protein
MTLNAIGVSGGGKTVSDANIAAFDPVERRKSLLKGGNARPSFWIILRDYLYEADAPYPLRLLRAPPLATRP